MRSLQLTIMLFCHVLLASVVFYFAASLAAASPITQNSAPQLQLEPPKQISANDPHQVPVAQQQVAPAIVAASPSQAISGVPLQAAPAPKLVLAERSAASVSEIKKEEKQLETPAQTKPDQPELKERKDAEKQQLQTPVEPNKKIELEPKMSKVEKEVQSNQMPVIPQAAALVAEQPPADSKQQVEARSQSKKVEEKSSQVVESAQRLVESSLSGKIGASEKPASPKPAPMVNGGLGPLHLLATTLCSYQPDRPVADDSLNQLYARRAIVRKSLFEFMSLKFTNLEKLSSRLGVGLQVVPVQSVSDTANSKPSHGWPVVGKCSAHDLKLMGEAAWCECQESSEQDCGKTSGTSGEQQQQTDKRQQVDSGKQKSARSIETTDSFSPEQASVISKLLLVGDAKDVPVVESNLYSLNLTQHQLASLQEQATTTKECRRNALRYSRALFQHLAEDQQVKSDSWPLLYAQISADDCARKRMIDIVNALSSFRTDTTLIRRDNVEFAFAMDDLRTKVLENEVNVPLTFDRHFIEVEQFLQQSVRLMLASVQPKKAKLTSMRYRSLMYGAAGGQDEQQQCIDLHQRLLTKNYPSDCDPTQFGQLPDVLRMTASSLELWSIEKELSLHLAKVADYPNITPVGQQKVKEDVNECIANLVAS